MKELQLRVWLPEGRERRLPAIGLNAVEPKRVELTLQTVDLVLSEELLVEDSALERRIAAALAEQIERQLFPPLPEGRRVLRCVETPERPWLIIRTEVS